MGLSGNSTELHFRAPNLGQNHKSYFMEKKEEVGKSCFEWKFIGEKQEFNDGNDDISYWLSGQVSQFLTDDTRYIFPCWRL